MAACPPRLPSFEELWRGVTCVSGMLLPHLIAHTHNYLLVGACTPAPSSRAGSTGGGQGWVEADTDPVIQGLCLAGSISPESGVRVLTFE